MSFYVLGKMTVVFTFNTNIPKDEYLECVALVLLRRMGPPISKSPCRTPGWVGAHLMNFFIILWLPKNQPSARTLIPILTVKPLHPLFQTS